MKIIKRFFYLLIGLAFLYNIKSFLYLDFSLFDWVLSEINLIYLFSSLLFYFLSHLMRTFRLYLLANDVSISFSNFLSLQLKANSVNLIFPFKLGEFYRIISFSKILGSNSKSLTTLMIERVFDFLVLFTLLSFGVLISDKINVSEISYIYIPVFLVAITLISIIILSQDSIILFQKRVLQRYKGVKSTQILKISSEILSIINFSQNLVYSKIFKLTLLTFIIWGLEILSTIFLVTFIGFKIDILILLGVYIAFSSLLPNGPLGIGGVQLSFYYIFNSFDIDLDYSALSYTYILFVFGFGFSTGIVLFILDLIKKILSYERK